MNTKLTYVEAVKAARRAFAVDPAIDSIVIRIEPDSRFPTGNPREGFAAFHHDHDQGPIAQDVTLHGVYGADWVANRELKMRPKVDKERIAAILKSRATPR